MSQDKWSISPCRFVVDEGPRCAWEIDPTQFNIAFLKGIDPGYFSFMAHVLAEQLENEEVSQQAAIALRGNYAHAAESFLAILFSAIQAPDYPAGWLHCYELKDLRSLANKIRRRQHVLNKWQLTRPSLADLVDLFHSPAQGIEKSVLDGFRQVWSTAMTNLVEPGFAHEYNSIKHGFRAKAGGHSIAFSKTPEPSPDERSPANFILWGSSTFGSTYYRRQKLIGQRHFRLMRHLRNWSPKTLVARIHVLSKSIHNIRDFLLNQEGVDIQTLSYQIPDETLLLEAASVDRHQGEFSMNRDFGPEDIGDLTDQQILEAYESGDEAIGP